MKEEMKYFILSNNPKIEQLSLKKEFKFINVKGSVKDVLDHSFQMLQDNSLKLVVDVMGGRNARHFPYVTILLGSKKEGESNESAWQRLIEYQILDERHRKEYEIYSNSLKNEFMILDMDLTKIALKNMQAIIE